MCSSTIQFVFEPGISLAEAEMSLHLAMFAVEGLIGRVRVRLDAKYHLDETNRTLVIDAHRPAGRMIARVFTGLLLRELGEGAFHVERADERSQHHPQEVQTCFCHRSGRAETVTG
jgi:hypothetical protein